MLKHSFVALLCTLIMACASGPAYRDANGDAIRTGNVDYYLGSVSVAMQQNVQVERFPNIHELHIVFQRSLKKKLAEAGLLGEKSNDQTLGWSLLIDYRRLFETNDQETATGVLAPQYSYRGTISRGSLNNVLGSYIVQPTTLDKGALGSIAIMGGDYAGADPDEELENIDALTEQMVDVLLKSQ